MASLSDALLKNYKFIQICRDYFFYNCWAVYSYDNDKTVLIVGEKQSGTLEKTKQTNFTNSINAIYRMVHFIIQ
jgi:hypothetical protein